MQRANRRFIGFLLIFIGISTITSIAVWPFVRELHSPENQEVFAAWITALGFRGVIVLFWIQVAQVVIAPVPGGPVQIFAGAVYGTWGGLFIMLAGWIAATILIFLLVRRFGLPLLRRIMGKDALDEWSFLSNEKKTSMAVFILFLIPGLPKSFIVYLGPLTKLPVVQFTLISIVARFPALLSSTAMGDAAMQGNWPLFFAMFGITAAAGIAGLHFKDRIIARFKR
ncbi:MAG: VTT domain-containing protein [Treponema sp.]|nr:VTT domain-containing protein [Treponema sp.]